MLDTLGAHLKLSAIVDSVLSNWHRHFHRNWSNFTKLTILSFHNEAGKQVDDTTTAANLAVLLPVQEGSISNLHRKHIQFVRVKLNLNFASLITLDPPGITILHIEYYIELPKGHHNMQKGSGGTYHLTTFLGPNVI